MRLEPRFTLGKDDLFQPGGGPFEVVRVMNALTARHFAEPQVVHGIRAVAATLVPGGLLALGRNIDEADGRLRATLFEKREGRLQPIGSVGEGYEMVAAVAEMAGLG